MPTRTPTPSHPIFAALYDTLNGRAEATLLRDHREYLAANLHGSVLDLGAGTGAMFPYFKSARRSDPSLTLHAIEPDPHMRRRAETRARDLDLDIEIRPDSAESLSYDDDSFDVVIASLVFCTIPDADAARDEVARVLEPDGEFRFLEHVHATGTLGRVQAIVNPVWRRGAAGCNLTRHTVEAFGADGRFALSDIEELDFGFAPVNPVVRGTLTRRVDAELHDEPAAVASRPDP